MKFSLTVYRKKKILNIRKYANILRCKNKWYAGKSNSKCYGRIGTDIIIIIKSQHKGRFNRSNTIIYLAFIKH